MHSACYGAFIWESFLAWCVGSSWRLGTAMAGACLLRHVDAIAELEDDLQRKGLQQDLHVEGLARLGALLHRRREARARGAHGALDLAEAAGGHEGADEDAEVRPELEAARRGSEWLRGPHRVVQCGRALSQRSADSACERVDGA